MTVRGTFNGGPIGPQSRDAAAHNVLYCYAWTEDFCPLISTHKTRTAHRVSVERQGKKCLHWRWISGKCADLPLGGLRLETRNSHRTSRSRFVTFLLNSSVKIPGKKYLEFGRDIFLPYPCQFTIHCLSFVLRYLAWFVNSVVKGTLLSIPFKSNLQHSNKRRGGDGNLKQNQSRSKRAWKYRSAWRCKHRASSYSMYINQQDAQNSCD